MNNKIKMGKKTKQDEIKELKRTIKLIFQTYKWIAIFLLIPTIGSYFLEWVWVKIARDTGILITTITTMRIVKAMKRKEKLLEKEKSQNKDEGGENK